MENRGIWDGDRVGKMAIIALGKEVVWGGKWGRRFNFIDIKGINFINL